MTLGLFFGAVAFLYAMVGHGGASGYLAVGSLAGLDPGVLKGQALVLNLLVAAFSSYSFTRAGFLRPKLLVPLVVFSMPAAYWGAKLPLHPALAKLLLGACLAAASWRMLFHFWLVKKAESADRKAPPPGVLALVGSGLGFLSGLTGVGGGIYLSPLLLLAGWASVKETAAASAWFIWLNSAAGLLGLSTGTSGLPHLPWEWILPSMAGGFLGANVGAKRLGEVRLRQALAAVLLMAACKLILMGAKGI
ncbi:MAG TPA: sulfite exporter TauE/SafE family protein [bacterium]|nr:sulfite exporter TauE/SafE family protein [bacterium]